METYWADSQGASAMARALRGGQNATVGIQAKRIASPLNLFRETKRKSDKAISRHPCKK